MTTTEKNKLIDLFMESKGEWISYKDVHGAEVWGNYKPHNYHSSWDCLMPVVEKIESVGGAIHICETFIFLHFTDRKKECERFDSERLKITRIEAVYNACVEFILWYFSSLGRRF